MKKIFIVSCLSMILMGCTKENREIHNIVGIYQTDVNGTRYSAYVGDKTSAKPITLDNEDVATLVFDVPGDQPMWAIQYDYGSITGQGDHMVLHLHKMSEVGGGRSGGKTPHSIVPIQ